MFQIHLWSGLILGLYIVVVCVSGSVLVFRNDIYDLIDEWLREGTATKSTPLVHWTYIVMRWTSELHGRLLLGVALGTKINAIGGFLTAAVCVTGLIIWWPGISRWRRALIVRGGVGWKRFNFDLHGALGFWTFAFLFVWGVTGGYFVFPEPFRAAVNYFTPIEAPRVVAAPVAPAREAEARPASATPSPQVQPAPQVQPPPRVQPVPPAKPAPQVAANVAPAQPAPLLRRRRRPLTTGGKILQWFSFLHYGNFAGWKVKALWAVLGLAPAILFGTALVMWWNRVVSPTWKRLQRSERGRVETPGTPAPELEWERE